MFRMTIAVLIALFATLPSLAADATAGAQIFKKCAACHSIGPGATTKVGPELNGVVARKAGSLPGYNFSAAMKNSGLTWDTATLFTYLHGPQKLVPGTKMTFPGLSSDDDVNNIIAYLSQYADDGTLKPTP